MARLFLSHSSADNVAALALRNWLAECGIDDVFLDIDSERGLIAGDRWQEALKTAADRCEAVLFLISSAWISSRWCLAEFLLAKTLHKRIFGLLIEEMALDRVPLEMTAEWQLCHLVGSGPSRDIDVEAGERTHVVAFGVEGLEYLRRGLERAGLGPRTFPWPPKTDPGRGPYRGLRALDIEDAAIFFGRDAMIVRALDRLRGVVEGRIDHCLIILGASGSGKSSFLRAGLLPRIARDDALFFALPIVRPEGAVLTGASGLVDALATAFQRLGAPRGRGKIKETLAVERDGFRDLLDELASLAKRRHVHAEADAPRPTLILSIDQAEELFNADGAAEAATFRMLLSQVLREGALEAGGPHLVLLVTIRSDRYQIFQLEEHFGGLKRQLLDLLPIPLSEFKSVIERPAERVTEAGKPLSFAPELTEQLIADAGGPDALPLLSFTLERLFADFGAEGRLTIEHYAKMGGVRGSIEEAVRQAFVSPAHPPAIPSVAEEQMARTRAAFIPWLARIDPETGVIVRRVARLREIPEGSRAIIDRLVAARLLVVDRRGDQDFVEVAHESLLRQWPALANWLVAEQANLKGLEGIERATEEWLHNERLSPWLDHRADRLAAARALMARDDFRGRIGADGLAYLDACVREEDGLRLEKEEALRRETLRLEEIAQAQRRTQTLQRAARWTLAALAVAVLIGLGFGVWQHLGNRRLEASLRTQATHLRKAQTKLFVQLAKVERLRNNLDADLRFAIYAARDLSADQPDKDGSHADVELATAMFRTRWVLLLGDHTRSVADAAFSPDGKRVVTASADDSAIVWDAKTGRKLLVLAGHGAPLWSAQFSPDGASIVTASEDKTARVWNAADGTQRAVLGGHGDKVTSASFSFDGKRIVTSSFDHTVRIWDVATAKEIAVLRGHTNSVQSARFSPDASRVVSASDDLTARIWDVATGRQIGSLAGHTGAVYYAVFSPDGTKVATASNDTTARLWDATSDQQLGILAGHKDYVNHVDFSPDGSKILTASADKTLRVWNATSFQEITTLSGHEDIVNAASFATDGKRIVSASHDTTARIWDVAALKTTITFRGHADGVSDAVMDATGSRIATASRDRTARVWDANTGAQLAELRGHEAPVRSVSFDPSGRHVVTASEDRTARIWDAASGELVTILAGHENWVMWAAYSPDGKRVATASWDQTARVFLVGTAQSVLTLRGHTNVVSAIAFSPDGTRIATASWDGTAKLWDAATGALVLTLAGHDGSVTTLAFDAAGKRIVTGSEDRSARTWDAVSGVTLATFLGHEDAVRSARFSLDGTRLVTASADHTVRVWDAATGRQTAILEGQDDDVATATFSPDGLHILTAASDKTARLWTLGKAPSSTRARIATACEQRLGKLSTMTREDMAFAGFDPKAPRIDVCDGRP